MNSKHLSCASRAPAITKDEIKQRQEYVIARSRNVVVTHVIGAGKLQARRQPFVHVNTPVDFFSCDQINTPSGHDAGHNSQPKISIKRKYQ